MPQVTVYIREEDIALWRGVVKKSEFMHNALRDRSTYDGAPVVLRETLPDPVETPETDEPEEEENQTFEEMGYIYDPVGGAIFDSSGERVPGKVDKQGRITEIL